MSLCIKYCGPNMKNVEKAEQIKIEYRPEDETLEQFIEINAGKHIYIEYPTERDLFGENKEDLQRFKALKSVGDNWTFQVSLREIITAGETINSTKNIKLAAIRDCCPHFMFRDIAESWEEFNFLLSMKPSEVYVGYSIAFAMDDIKKRCNREEVKVRAYANVAQKIWFEDEDTKQFFIRPNDVKLYEKYLDGIDFVGDANIQDIMFDIYSKGEWAGNLDEIIVGLGEPVNNITLPDKFGEYRLNCKKRCLVNGSCHLCNGLRLFADTFAKGLQRDAEVNGYVDTEENNKSR